MSKDEFEYKVFAFVRSANGTFKLGLSWIIMVGVNEKEAAGVRNTVCAKKINLAASGS
jgi:hypothetical protein